MLVAVSESTGEDLKRFYSVEDDRVVVAPLGVEPEFYARGRELRPSRSFCACRHCIRTRISKICLRAFARFREEQPEFPARDDGRSRLSHGCGGEPRFANSGCRTQLR